MDSDEEVDYMSDSFLESISGKDIRPGLINSHAQQYNHRQALKKMKKDKVNREKNPSMKEMEVVSREIGLDNPINNDNIGFKMLQKLGFKPGSGLGKSGEGRTVPVSIEFKADRGGFGRKSALEEIARMRAKYKATAKENLLNVDSYRLRKAEEASERRVLLELTKCQRVCWELDSKECIEEPVEIWFWPKNKLPKILDEESYDEDETEIENETDILNEGHTESNEEVTKTEDSEEDNSFIDDNISVHSKLEILTMYMRRTYLYCVWCGHSFEDEKDLQQDCPGPFKEDH